MPRDAVAERPEVATEDLPGIDLPVELLQQDRSLKRLADLFEPLPAPSQEVLGIGQAAWLSVRAPAKTTLNEDAVAAVTITPERGLLMVADGLGGHRGGREASQQLVTALKKGVRRLITPTTPKQLLVSRIVPVPTRTPALRQDLDSRSVILDQIERVNRRLLRSRTSGATTLALVEYHGSRVRTYHVGDSEILIVSRQGRVKYATVSHSPVGYAYESGLLTEEDALFHPDRHLVSNVVGSELMSVQIGPWIDLSACDTVLLGSDGLFDNLLQSEIVETIRKGRLDESVRDLAKLARDRMTLPHPDRPSKPDDLTILAYRPNPMKRRPGAQS